MVRKDGVKAYFKKPIKVKGVKCPECGEPMELSILVNEKDCGEKVEVYRFRCTDCDCVSFGYYFKSVDEAITALKNNKIEFIE